MFRNLLLLLAPFALALPSPKGHSRLQTFHHVNEGASVNVVSTLIVGSEAAAIVDMPVAVPNAKQLAEWVRQTTDKPLVAAFTSHFHPDHYLSAGAFLEEFPNATYYANEGTVAEIISAAPAEVADWSTRPTYGVENITQNTAIPIPYNYSFFVLPGNEDEPVHIMQTLNGDTVDLSFFWIPSLDVVIAADTVYDPEMHIWLSDLQSHAMAQAWLDTLDFIEGLRPRILYPGHGATGGALTPPLTAIQHTRDYVTYFMTEVQGRGENYYTVAQFLDLFHTRFPNATNVMGEHMLEASAATFGSDGEGPALPASVMNNTDINKLNGYILH